MFYVMSKMESIVNIESLRPSLLAYVMSVD